MRFADEGYWDITLSVSAAILATFFLGWYCLLFWVAAIFIAQFFRDPPRHTPQAADALISPADGKVVFIGEAQRPASDGEGEYARHDNERCLKISIFMNVYDVHVNRAAADGTVLHTRHHQGRFFNAALDKASRENERHLIRLRTDRGIVDCVQVAGFIARRILCYVKPGERLVAGERFGFIRYGSRMDVYCPLSHRALVALGDRTVGGETLLATANADG